MRELNKVQNPTNVLAKRAKLSNRPLALALSRQTVKKCPARPEPNFYSCLTSLAGESRGVKDGAGVYRILAWQATSAVGLPRGQSHSSNPRVCRLAVAISRAIQSLQHYIALILARCLRMQRGAKSSRSLIPAMETRRVPSTGR